MELSPVPDDVPAAVYGDPTRVRQILTNLIANAIKFTETGSVRVELLQASGPPSFDEAPMLVWRVVDTGVGLAADRAERIFEAFAQVDASVARRYGGTGLGLAICRSLVTAMGGVITVESELGVGTSFEVSIVCEPAPEAAVATGPSEPPRASDAPPTSARVLLAEDNEVNQLVARGLLERYGFHVTVVGDGRAAVDALAAGEFDVVLMDVQMPTMDGYEAARTIRAERDQRFDPHIPIIAVTANAMREDEARCLAAGMNSYVSKPYTADEVAGAIRSALA